MPCSCGSTCPCGIPCYCSEESCKCYACAIAVHRLCTICNKPLITDIQRNEDTCSCFVGESTALIVQNQGNNTLCRMGNLPIPSSFGYFTRDHLVFNATIPRPSFPQFTPREPTFWMSPPSEEAHSRNILSPLISKGLETPLSGKDSGLCSPEFNKFQKSNEQSCRASFGICSPYPPNTEISCKDARPKLILESTDERKIADTVQNTQPVTEGYPNVQERTSFYLPSVRIGNNSCPVTFSDSVWNIPNREFSIAGRSDSCLEVRNPFKAGQIQQVSTIEKGCYQQASGLNFDANGLSLADDFLTPQMNVIMDQSNLKMKGESVERAVASTIFAGNGFTSRNSNAIPWPEQWEMSTNYLMNDQTPFFSNNIQFYGAQEFCGVQKPDSTLVNERNEENDPIPLYISSSTTENMERVMKPSKNSNAS